MQPPTVLDEFQGVKLLSYTYPQGEVVYRVIKGRSVLAMTRNYAKAQDVFGDAINGVRFGGGSK
jgi:hypothetical protein